MHVLIAENAWFIMVFMAYVSMKKNLDYDEVIFPYVDKAVEHDFSSHDEHLMSAL